MIPDGQGLHLCLKSSGAKSWVLTYTFGGSRREMGLGPAVSANALAEGREAADQARTLLRAGIDPIAARQKARADAARVEPVVVVRLFGEYAEECIVAWSASFRSAVTTAQWLSSIKAYCAPILLKEPRHITTEDVLAILLPIWLTKHETADRVRARIERILSAARANNIIPPPYENPAHFKGHLQHLLPKWDSKNRKHHVALPYDAAPAFMARLRARPGRAGQALAFTILTAARTSETTGARRGEIDGDIWTIPAGRMKGNIEHRVALTPAALAALGPLGDDPNAYLFLNPAGEPLSNGAMERVLDRMGVAVTVHGWRSTFSDWANDTTAHAEETVEQALAHQEKNEVRRAYRRGDGLEKRRSLMQDWAGFCARAAGGNVIQMARAGG